MSGKVGPIRVLVVEDEPLLGRLTLQCLEGFGGMEGAWADNGEEGLALAWSWRPDVILLDLVLPEMSGVELLRQYRLRGGMAKVLVTTGADPGRIQGTLFALGADLVLRKPVRWKELLEQIRLLGDGLEGLCQSLLKAMGAKGDSKGFFQASECAALLGRRKCGLLKEAYIEVARRRGTTPDCVAKNVERLARDLHREGTPLYYRLAERKVEEPHLTAGEFLDLLSRAARIPL